MQARFYLPMYGRFASPDPARDQHFEETQSWNIYSYVQNNPIMRTDPTGMVGEAISAYIISWMASRSAKKPAEPKPPTLSSDNEEMGSRLDRAIEQIRDTALMAVNLQLTLQEAFGNPNRNSNSSATGVAEASARTEAKVATQEASQVVPALTEGQASNLKRFGEGFSASVRKGITVTAGEDGSVVLRATKPGKVPGSCAVYEKVVNPDGTSVKVSKTTLAPDGSIVHVKDKL